MMKAKFRKLESSGDEAVAAEQSRQWQGAGQHWKSQGGDRPEKGRLEKLVVDVWTGLNARRWKGKLKDIITEEVSTSIGQ